MAHQSPLRQVLNNLRPEGPPNRFRETLHSRLFLLVTVGAVLILLYAYFIHAYLGQRGEQGRMATELENARSLLATTQPGLDEEVGRLREDLNAAQGRLVSAQAALPGSGENVSIVDSILQAGNDSGVNVTMLRAQDAVTETVANETFGALSYQVRAEGDLDALMTFITRLENELAPGTQLTDTTLHARGDTYRFDGVVRILTSTIARVSIPQPRPTPGNEERIASLRTDYQAAMASSDYELALSVLIRLKARQPDASDISKLFYDTYVAYGEALLANGSPELAEEQFVNALAIDPNGNEAVLGLLKVKAAITATPPVSVTPGGPVLPTPVSSPSPARPAQNTATAIPSPTRFPVTAAPTGTPTVTRTPTATGTATATPSPYEFVVKGDVSYLPNCGLTSIQGYITDESGRPLRGTQVKVWWDGAPADLPLSKESGTDPTKASGYYDYTLAAYPKAGKWYVAVFDPDRGWEISERLTVFTDDIDCNDRGAGHQVVTINWQRAKGGVGQYQPTSTASPVGTGTTIPTYTPRPTYTPTISPTPTLEPHSYPRDETPDLDIPDFPAGPAISIVTVADDFDIRDVRILINITHDDIRDLVVTLVSPAGTRVTLYQAGPNDTQRTEIRGWFTTSTTPALKNVIDQVSLGDWDLEALDQVEGRTGTLQSWTLELFPK